MTSCKSSDTSSSLSSARLHYDVVCVFVWNYKMTYNMTSYHVNLSGEWHQFLHISGLN